MVLALWEMMPAACCRAGFMTGGGFTVKYVSNRHIPHCGVGLVIKEPVQHVQDSVKYHILTFESETLCVQELTIHGEWLHCLI